MTGKLVTSERGRIRLFFKSTAPCLIIRWVYRHKLRVYRLAQIGLDEFMEERGGGEGGGREQRRGKRHNIGWEGTEWNCGMG